MIFSKRCLGIDVGASSIKVVELEVFGKRKRLKNYAEFQFPFKKPPATIFSKKNFNLLSNEVAEILKILFKRAGIKRKKVIISIPDFSTFFTTFDLPPMTQAEVPQAVEFEARHHIPLSLSEVTFDWQVIEKKEILPGVKLKILLVAVPNRILESYQKMATIAGLEIEGMEAEVFGLIRSSLSQNTKNPVCLVDIGRESTTVSIVQERVLRLSQSFDISGKDFTEAISQNLKIDYEKAEVLKRRHGLDPAEKKMFAVLVSKISELAREIESVCESFQEKEDKKIEEVILAGGTATLFGLKEYLETHLARAVYITAPFSQISFPSILKERLQKIGPSFGVAVGAALRGAES
ncbi:MAG: type IV pilus assembly protein PilM [Patescibacteria group bacterium]|nr:type IV pilus assembly protein PilM [Patescibacteria group bacterium]